MTASTRFGLVALRHGKRLYGGAAADKNGDNDGNDHVATPNDEDYMYYDVDDTTNVANTTSRRRLAVIRLTGRSTSQNLSQYMKKPSSSLLSSSSYPAADDKQSLTIGRIDLLKSLWAACGCDDPESTSNTHRCPECQRQTEWAAKFLSRRMLRFQTHESSNRLAAGGDDDDDTDNNNNKNKDVSAIVMRFRGDCNVCLNDVPLKKNDDQNVNDYTYKDPEGWSHPAVPLHVGDKLSFRPKSGKEFQVLESRVVRLYGRNEDTGTLEATTTADVPVGNGANDNDPKTTKTKIAEADENLCDQSIVKKANATADATVTKEIHNDKMADDDDEVEIVAVVNNAKATSGRAASSAAVSGIYPVAPLTSCFSFSGGPSSYVLYLAVEEQANSKFERGIAHCRSVMANDQMHQFHMQLDESLHVTLWKGMLTSAQANHVVAKIDDNTSFPISFQGWCPWGDSGAYLQLTADSKRHLKHLLKESVSGLPHTTKTPCDHLSLYRMRGADGQAKTKAKWAFTRVKAQTVNWDWGTVQANSIRLKQVGTDYRECRVLVDFVADTELTTEAKGDHCDQKKCEDESANTVRDYQKDDAIPGCVPRKPCFSSSTNYEMGPKRRSAAPQPPPAPSSSIVRVYLLPVGRDFSKDRRKKVENKLLGLGATIWTNDDTSVKPADNNIMIISGAVESMDVVTKKLRENKVKMKHWIEYKKKKGGTANADEEDLFRQYLEDFHVICVLPHWADACVSSKSLLVPPTWAHLWSDSRADQSNDGASNVRDSLGQKRPRADARQQCGNQESQGMETLGASKRTRRRFPLNAKVAEQFKILSSLHQSMPLNDQDRWKSYSLRIASGRLMNLDFEVSTDPETISRLKQIKGFGDGTIDKILQFLNDGKLHRIEEFQKDPDRMAIKLLTDIWGIGMARAKELSNQGYKNVKMVRNGLRRGQIVLDRNQLVGVECYDDILDRMDRFEVETIANIVEKAADALFPGIEVSIMGSYRRGKRTCGDVDLHLTHPKFEEDIPDDALGRIINSLWNDGHIAFHLTILNGMSEGLDMMDFQKACKHVPDDTWTQTRPISANHERNRHTSFWMGVMNSPCVKGKRRRVDIKLYSYRDRIFASIYFTGNGYFNRSMRLWASYKFGLKLSDHGLVNAEGRRVMEATTEEEVFEYLKILWKEPEERDCFDALEPKDEFLEAGEMEFSTKKEFFEDSEKHIWVE